MDIDSKRTNVPAVLIPEYVPDSPPGHCTYDAQTGRMSFACPGCGQWGGVNCGHPKPAQGPSWNIVKGSPNDPSTLTLDPSIHCIGCCGWHGYLKEGLFVSC